MANTEHVEILKSGAATWNRWRDENPKVTPDLSGSIHAWFFRKIKNISDESPPDLSGLDLSGANLNDSALSFADFTDAKLKKASFRHANLFGASFKRADLWGANFFCANAVHTDFSSAVLAQAELRRVDLTEADLSNADLSVAYMGHTILERVDLTAAKGLNMIYHDSSSVLGVSTLYKTKDEIPGAFLRGCGLPEDFIKHLPMLITAMQPIQFYSCFISYSSTDQEFADRLHTDLQAKGVRVWFAPHDLPIGARIRPAIDESIRVYDKLLLVLSEASVTSQWVEQEVETALAREREPEGKTVLFPVRIDDAVMKVKTGWPAYLRNTRNVGDFTRWKEHDSYQKAFNRLLRGLKAKA